MRFWDSSALVPVCTIESASERVMAMLRSDPGVAVWWGAPIECLAGIVRQERVGLVTPEQGDKALAILRMLTDSWFEVQPSERVRALATRLVRVHMLRAADAFQLAAALVWIDEAPPGEFVTLDRRLQAAARLEGFKVLP